MTTESTVFLGMSLDMMIGMVAGMIASPLVMKAAKVIRHKRKMNRLFSEMAEYRQNEGIDDATVSNSSGDKVL